MGDTGASGAIGFLVIIAIFASTGIAGALFLLAITRRFGNTSKVIAFVAGIILIPCLLISIPIAYELLKDAKRRSISDANSRSIAFAYLGDDLNALIDRYYRENPGSFTFPNNDETPYSTDLLAYLATNPVFLNSGFSIRGDSLISPFDDKVLLVIDRNGDGAIITTN